MTSLTSFVADVEVLTYAVRSAILQPRPRGKLLNTLESALTCLQSKKKRLELVEKYGESERLPKEQQKVLVGEVVDACLAPLRTQVPNLSEVLQQLSQPLPEWLVTAPTSTNHSLATEVNLQLELQLYDWLEEVLEGEVDFEQFARLAQSSEFADLNLKTPGGTALAAFVTYDTIVGSWGYKGVRGPSKPLSEIIERWKDLFPNLTLRNEFMGRKQGVVLVFRHHTPPL